MYILENKPQTTNDVHIEKKKSTKGVVMKTLLNISLRPKGILQLHVSEDTKFQGKNTMDWNRYLTTPFKNDHDLLISCSLLNDKLFLNLFFMMEQCTKKAFEMLSPNLFPYVRYK